MLATSIIRRFTPPTCTLEIKAKNSPLSRWTNKSILNNLHFRLSFDDPKIPEEEQVTIKGDRLQLEQLYNVTIDYIQNFLHQSFTNSNFTRESTTSDTQPYLQRQGLVSHELYLGSLGNDHSITKIQLSSVQLFDLVTALEEYHTQIVALPELDSIKSHNFSPIWGSIAAAVILAIGLTTTAVRLSQDTESDSIASSSKSQPLETLPQLDDLVSPQIPKLNQTTPKPQTKEPLSSSEKLPPPPPVDLLKPQPNIPDPAQYPLPEVATRANVKTPNAPEPSTSNKEDSQQVISTFTVQPKTQSRKSKTESSTIAIAPKDIEETTQESSRTSSDKLSNEIDSVENDNDILINNPVTLSSPLVEVTRYFEEKWQAPTELRQSLEYRLVVGADGTIRKVLPIGKASEIYLDRTNIPLQGEVFISPLKEQNQITIRLLLNPDGEVITLLE